MGKFYIGRKLGATAEPENTTVFTGQALDSLPNESFEEPKIVYIERPVEIIKEIIREIEKPIEKIVEVEKRIEVQVEKIIEKPVEIVKTEIKEVIQYIDRIVPKIHFRLPIWAMVVMAVEAATILALLLRR